MVSPERLDSLQQSWVRLLGGCGVTPADAYPVFDLLVAAYSATERHYHNLEHLAEMFRVAARLGTLTNDPAPVQLAIWFHDVVYDSRADDNEARSAELAIALLGPIGVRAAVLEQVARLIHGTAHLTDSLPPADHDAMTILDADLAILGAAEPRYQRYAADIRREYDWVPDADYRTARTKVLQRFLARPRIFWHDLMYLEGEERARLNIQAELVALTEFE